MNDALHLVGRLHPLLLHAPLGALGALAALELWSAARGRELEARRPLAVFTALTALAAAGSGWLLAGAEGYGGELLFRHRWAGVTLAGLLLVTALLARAARTRPYVGGLVLASAASVLAGHWGATITHGPDYFRLDEPAPRKAPSAPAGQPTAGDPAPDPAASDAADASPPADVYASEIAPILSAHCVACHGPTKQKAKLALDTPEGIAAGSFLGPVVVPGDPEGSEMLRRLRLPLEDDEHMPPPGKPQPSTEQIARIEAWIRGGARLPAVPGAPAPVAPQPAESSPAEAPLETGDAGEPAPEAVAHLLEERVHVELVDPVAQLLWIDCAGRPDADDALLSAWLSPLQGSVVELSLAGTGVTDAGLALAARMPRLERLDLSRTGVTSAGLAALAGHARLRVLNVSGTAVDDGLAELDLPELARLFCAGSALTAQGLARCVAAHPGLEVPAGEARDALETEAPPILGAPDALRPPNATCPVSGQPVDRRYTVVWNGAPLGFCCAQCPATFWEDPNRYAVN